MKFKVGDVVEDCRYKNNKYVAVITEVQEYSDGTTFLNAYELGVDSKGQLIRVSFTTYHPEDVVLLVKSQPDPLFKLAEDIGLQIPEVSSEHTL